MVGWHHGLNQYECEQTPGDSEGQGSLVCYSPWGLKESDMAERQNNLTNVNVWLEEKQQQSLEHGVPFYWDILNQGVPKAHGNAP